jgi:Ca-activated chloride channel family protein
MGASVTTIGVDVQYDEKVMSALARSSNGHHFFVGDPTGLPTIFDSEMASLAKTVANKAELTLDLAPGVIADRVFDRSSTITSGSQVVVPLGSFSAGDHKTVLVHVRVPRGDAGERPIAAVRLHYDDLADTKPGDCEGVLGARLTTVASEISPLDSFVSARLSASEAAGVLEASNALFRQGKNEEAQGLIRQEQVHVAAARHAAIQAAPTPAAAAEADKQFGKSDAALGSGAGGFDRKPTATTPDADVAGQRQIRRNQQTAVDATE